ncbi:MAG: Nramp family divalent metal transporter [Patescibacteria group bacterium]
MPKKPPTVKPNPQRPSISNRIKRLGRFWHQLGPGLTTGAADDDPSGIATYSQTGSRFGFQLLWLAAFTFPFMTIVQEMCARIGLVTGRGLAANIRLHFPRWMLYLCTVLLFIANTFNIGADLGAMAEAANLIAPQLKYALLLIGFTVVTLILEIFTSYRKYSKVLKILALVLLAYVITALTLKGVDWGDVARRAVIPSLQLSRDQILLICGILGTTISPYLFFWQASQEVEEEILDGQTTIKARSQENNWPEIRAMRKDVWTGMFFSNIVMFFIILTTGAVLHPAGITNIDTAAQAAEALRPFAGKYATLLFAVGIIGIGLLAIPVLAGSAAYAFSESFRWHEGLYRKLKNAYAFYGVIIAAIVIGFAINFIGLDPIKALIYAAILNGIIAPILMIFIMLISGSKKHLGEYANSRPVNVLGWIITFFMIIVAIASIIFLFLK